MTDAPDPDIAIPDTAIALRRAHVFPPRRRSVFEDPADEKSAHGSQRYSSLMGFYRGRDPGWYASVTREFAGARRVLDLGAGPGLALAAMAKHGVGEPIGVDRWYGFAQDATAAGRTLVLHDMTLPMPFFRSGAFDGIFSHYSLDYMSPIGVRQVLLEARRLLAPGGRMTLYLAGVGLTLGDLSRTSPFGQVAFTRMLGAAGFQEFEIERTPDGRNTVVRVERAGEARPSGGGSRELEQPVEGEVQLSVGLRPKRLDDGEAPFAIELDGDSSLSYRPRLSPRSPLRGESVGEAVAEMSVCVRLVPLSEGAWEFQLWAWRRSQPVAVDTLRLSAKPDLLRLTLDPGAGAIEYSGTWEPRPHFLEEPGDAYAPLEGALGPQTAEGGWVPRARRVLVEGEGDDAGLLEEASDATDEFLIRRPGEPGAEEVSALDREWLAGRAHGIVLDLERALRAESLPLILWASWRGALLYLEPESWLSLDALTGPPWTTLRSPLLLVDPALAGGGPGEQADLEGAGARALQRLEGAHLVLDGPTIAGALRQDHPTRVLIAQAERAGTQPPEGDQQLAESAETLRYLTERTTLMWFRSSSGRLDEELGRRPHAVAA